MEHLDAVRVGASLTLLRLPTHREAPEPTWGWEGQMGKWGCVKRSQPTRSYQAMSSYALPLLWS